MRLLQRYIMFELLKVFSFLLSILTILLVFVGVFREATEKGLGPAQALQVLPYVVPSLMPFTIPATLLLTVCLVYGRMAGDQEVTAAKAAGINVMSMLWPALLLGITLSLVSLVLTDQVIPWAMTNIQRIVSEAMEDIFLDMLRTKHLVADPSRGVSVMVMDVDGKTLIRPTFRYSPPGSDPVMIQAQQATISFDMTAREIVLHLDRGQADLGGDKSISIRDNDVRFPMPKELADAHPRHLTIREIRQAMGKLQSELDDYVVAKDLRALFALTLGEFHDLGTDESLYHREFEKPKESDLRKLHTEVHSRLAMSTSCLFFVLIGGPFAMLQARRQFLTSFILCFVPILVVYYPLALGMMNLSKTGSADPTWAMWVGNAVLLTAGLHILRKVLRH
ncbi:MAG: LptF/LptG family permease [Planctomycetaceae bacterium]|nr:LptF/LptG family permease [Planctomycetaceae bacterium]